MGALGRYRGTEQSGRTFVILNIDIILFKTHFWDAREILFSLVAYKSHIKKKCQDITVWHLFLKEQSLAY